MLLSIVMMIKNEEKNLERTLIALKPLMEEINSELIILDTGSEDNSVNIAKKYTKYVYFEKWNNNFSDMRNKSIAYAKGDWILILDADEELIDFKNIIKFFNNNLCNIYNTGTIELKSILSEDGKEFNVGCIPRLFKKYEGFKYSGAIHEQPLYKEPIYNRVASFNHYGYLFVDEELRQRKNSRNKEILFKELENDLDNPYLNYQLAKEHIISRDYEDALLFMEKSYNEYNKNNCIPIYVTLDLIALYENLNKLEKCKTLCLNYIEKDKNNIDVYYYLGSIERKLRNYEESIKYYKRYKYLIDNYEISTQANDMRSPCNTISYLAQYEINLISNYYDLEMYDKIIDNIESLSEDSINQLYFIIFMSLSKSYKIESILDLYYKYCKTDVEKSKFYLNTELFIKNSSYNDKQKIYKVLSQIESNYGILNKVRLGYKLNLNELSRILKEERDGYYGDLIYIYINDKVFIDEILYELDREKLDNYISYLIINRKKCVINLYEKLISTPISLNVKFLKVYSCLAKMIFFYGNLTGEKYNQIFKMYISYQYEYVKNLYNNNLTDCDIVNLISDKENIFVIKFVNIQKNSKNDKLQYIRDMKRLLLDNNQYKNCIKFIMDAFEEEINEKEELKMLKVQYKSIIEDNLRNGKLSVCDKLINEYEDIFKYEKLNNIKAIVELQKDNLQLAYKYINLAYCDNKDDIDLLFNIAYIKEFIGDIYDSIRFYDLLLKLNLSDKLKEEVIIRLDNLKAKI